MKKRFNIKNNLGFTLAETLVVVGIIAMLSTIVVVQMNQSDPEAELERNKFKFESTLELARNYATSGQNQSETGYGIYTEQDENFFIFYADLDSNYKYNTDEEIKTYYLDNGLYFAEIENDYDIFFSLYEASLYSDGSKATDDVSLTIAHENDPSIFTEDITISYLTSKIQ